MTAGVLTCSSCGSSVAAGDRFCESCGQSVVTNAVDRAVKCVACGAGDGIDADGYCVACGHKQPSGREHLEIDLGPLAAVTDRGRRHHRNEDDVAIARLTDASLIVVSDGVSSTSDADSAARAAVTATMARLAGAIGDVDLAPALREAATEAQKAVAELASPQMANPPSCTWLAIVRRKRQCSMAWLGDCRAYWIDASSDAVVQLTIDHSWGTDEVRAGRLTQAEADADPRSHAITRWLGADNDTTPEPDLVEFTAPGPGRLLVCSDGFWNYVTGAAALRGLIGVTDSETPLALATRLCAWAEAAGGHDNITVVIDDVERGEST